MRQPLSAVLSLSSQQQHVCRPHVLKEFSFFFTDSTLLLLFHDFKSQLCLFFFFNPIYYVGLLLKFIVVPLDVVLIYAVNAVENILHTRWIIRPQ